MNHPTETITASQISDAVTAEAARELKQALQKITHCLNQLSDEQIWWRIDESQNSIGNLILHLAGNLRQWSVCGLGGNKDERNRPEEFTQRVIIPKPELLARLEAVVNQAIGILPTLTAADWLRVRRIQGFEVTGLAALFDTVPHFRGHTQEIIYRTRCLLGQKYQFWWKPSSPEQGATA